MIARMNRRRFLAGTARAACAAIPVIIPPSVLGRAGRIAPSQRIVIGCIGGVPLS